MNYLEGPSETSTRWRSVVSRITVSFLGFVWLLISYVGMTVGQRELEFSWREWFLLFYVLCAVFMIAASLSPRSFWRYGVFLVVFTAVILWVEVRIIALIYHYIVDIYSVSRFGNGVMPGTASDRLLRSTLIVAVAALLGTALALSAIHLLRSAKAKPGG
jgi:hypothetical protein